MYISGKRLAVALLALSALLPAVPSASARISVNGQDLAPQEAWIEDGTTWVQLRAWGEHTGYTVSWENGVAVLKNDSLTLQVRPGAYYFTANGNPLFVKGGIPVREGRICLPLRVLAEAAGGQALWHPETGDVTLDLSGSVPQPAMSREEADMYWLARVISAESRGEPMEGQIAVGTVVLNRIASPQFPDTIQDVVFDDRYAVQFEPVENGTIYEEPAASSVEAAARCLAGERAAGDSLYFFAPALSEGTWIVEHCTYVTTIGGHRFYR